MSVQGSLFDAPATAGTHRQRDPQTSVDAARQVDAAARCQEVHDGLVRLGGSATAWELTVDLRVHGIDTEQNIVARRLKDLEEDGRVRRTDEKRLGRSSRYLIVWTITDTP